MNITMTDLHPDDVLFFHEVAAAMRRVAKAYGLPLRGVSPLSMPETGMIDRKGDCSGAGDIRLVMRCTVDGQWCAAPRTPADVWNTAAHELAHLRFMNHGDSFKVFFLEMQEAIHNQQEDHQQKILNKLIKLQAAREGEAALGNSAAAEAFAGMINKMLHEHELSPSDIDYARATDKDPVIEVRVNLGTYKIKSKRQRSAWQESLARIVANAHLCKYLITTGSNQIYFVGTKSHAMVAEYAYGTLVPLAEKMSKVEMYRYGAEVFKRDGNWAAKNGFRQAWLSAFIERISERFKEARSAAVAESPVGASTALIRLSGALRKAEKYVDDKFKSKRGVSALNLPHGGHAEARQRGRAAADAMTLGRAVGGAPTRGLLK